MSDEHRHFDEIADSLAGGSDKTSAGTGGLSRPLIAEVLSRVAVRTPPVATRAQIGSGKMLRAAVPLSEGSVSKAVASLLRHELLTESHTDEDQAEGQDSTRRRGVGRPVATVRLAGHRWFSVGVHVRLDGDRPVAVTAVAVSVDDHEVLATETQDVRVPDDASDDSIMAWAFTGLVKATVAAVHALVEHPPPKARGEPKHPKVARREVDGWLPLLGVCVSIGLRVHNGAVLAPAGENLRAFALRGPLFAALGIPVLVENDVNVLAVRETYGQKVHRDFALVLVAENGVRAAVAIDGRVRRGAQGMAGEIGTIDVRDGSTPLTAHRPRPGSVDFHASPAGMQETLGVDSLDNADLATPEAQEVLSAGGRSLGAGLAALVRVVDPAQLRIVVPATLRGGPGLRYLDEADQVLAATYASLGRRATVSLDRDPDDYGPGRFARAAAIRVVVEFIDHLSGIDGCPPRERSVPSWLASGRAAAAGGALGILIAPMVPVVPMAAAYAGARFVASRIRNGLARRVRIPHR